MLRGNLPEELNLHILSFLELDDLAAYSFASKASSQAAHVEYEARYLRFLQSATGQSNLWQYLPIIVSGIAENDGKRQIDFFKQYLGRYAESLDSSCRFQDIIEYLKSVAESEDDSAYLEDLLKEISTLGNSLLSDVYVDSNYAAHTYPASLNDFLRAGLKDNDLSLLGKYKTYCAIQCRIILHLADYFILRNSHNVANEPQSACQQYVLEFLSSPAMAPYRTTTVAMFAKQYEVYAFEYLLSQTCEYYTVQNPNLDVEELGEQLQLWFQDITDEDIAICIDTLRDKKDVRLLSKLNMDIRKCLHYSYFEPHMLANKLTYDVALTALEACVELGGSYTLARYLAQEDVFGQLKLSEQQRLFKVLSLDSVYHIFKDELPYLRLQKRMDGHFERLVFGYIDAAEGHAELKQRLEQVLSYKDISGCLSLRKATLLGVALMLTKAKSDRRLINQVLEQFHHETLSVAALLEMIRGTKDLDVNGNETDVAANLIEHYDGLMDERAIIGVALTSSYSKAAFLKNVALLNSLKPASLLLFVESAGVESAKQLLQLCKSGVVKIDDPYYELQLEQYASSSDLCGEGYHEQYAKQIDADVLPQEGQGESSAKATAIKWAKVVGILILGMLVLTAIFTPIGMIGVGLAAAAAVVNAASFAFAAMCVLLSAALFFKGNDIVRSNEPMTLARNTYMGDLRILFNGNSVAQVAEPVPSVHSVQNEKEVERAPLLDKQSADEDVPIPLMDMPSVRRL